MQQTDNDIARIIGFHDAVLEHAEQVMGGLPSQGLGGSYRVRHNGFGSDSIWYYSSISLSRLDNTLQWGTRRKIISGGDKVWDDSSEDLLSDQFLQWAKHIRMPGVQIGPFELYIYHMESFRYNTKGKGLWQLKSRNLSTVTSEQRQDFVICPSFSGYDRLKGMDMTAAATRMIDHLYKMYSDMGCALRF